MVEAFSLLYRPSVYVLKWLRFERCNFRHSSSLKKTSFFFFLCLEYPRIDDVIQAVKSKEVDGMLLDRFTASYYQSRGKLQSLLTVKKVELQMDTGVLFSQDREELAECLNLHRSNILKSVQTFAATYKVLFITIKGLNVSTCLSFSPG